MNNIHSTVIIEGDVKLGKNNKILPYTTLTGPLSIGDNNIIGPHVVIGSPGQDTRNPRYDSSDCRVEIGNNNIIREFTAIQKPAYKNITKLGDDIYLMQSVHIPHDAIIEDNVVITPMCVLGGITRVMKAANIGMGASIHQNVVIGPYSILATGAAAVKNIKPFSRHIPNKPISVNAYAIKKYGFSEYMEEITEYVLDNKKPLSSPIQKIVNLYNLAHESSGNKEY